MSPTSSAPTIWAAEGCRFTDFHVAAQICQPNRTSLMTGRLPSAHCVQMTGRELSHGERTFVETLRESGYRTAADRLIDPDNAIPTPAWSLPALRQVWRSRVPFIWRDPMSA